MDTGCAILADRHLGLAEGLRGLIEGFYQRVYMVGDVESLTQGIERLHPALVVLDSSLVGPQWAAILEEMRASSPGLHVILLTLHEPVDVVLQKAGALADAVVLKRVAGRDLPTAIEAVTNGRTFCSTGNMPDPGDAAMSR